MNNYQNIEKKRIDFSKIYRKYKLINNIIMGALAIIIGVTLVLLLPKGNEGMIASIVIIVVLLVLLLVYSHFMKKYIRGKVDMYLNDFYVNVTLHAFEDIKVSNFKQSVSEKLDPQVFYDARILKDVNNVNSRNYVSYTYNNKNIVLVDTAAYKVLKRKQTPIFVGKLLSVDLEKEYKGRTIIYRLQDNNDFVVVGPNDTDDLRLIKDEDAVRVYTDNEKNVVSAAFIKAIKEIKTTLPLIDLTISIMGKTATFALSYNNDIMSVPLFESFKEKSLDSYKEDIEQIHKLIDLL